MLPVIAEILGRCGTAHSVMPPTALFNEGWMLRLMLDWFARHRDVPHELAFEPAAKWYSEALLASRFLPTSRPDPHAESFTHADGVIGHFDVQSRSRGDIRLSPNPTQLVVVEAKLGSPLSAGTKNAATFDQAARNVACIAHLLGEARIDPMAMKKLAFYVVAPQTQINNGVFGELVSRKSVKAKVVDRIASYNARHGDWFEKCFLPTLDRIDLKVLAWEAVLNVTSQSAEGAELQVFYSKCLQYNPLRGKNAP